MPANLDRAPTPPDQIQALEREIQLTIEGNADLDTGELDPEDRWLVECHRTTLSTLEPTRAARYRPSPHLDRRPCLADQIAALEEEITCIVASYGVNGELHDPRDIWQVECHRATLATLRTLAGA